MKVFMITKMNNGKKSYHCSNCGANRKYRETICHECGGQYEDCTCTACYQRNECEFAFDSYNMWGDCLKNK